MDSPTDTRIAFIGLGVMGLPMALNLHRAGFSVVGHNRSPARSEAFAAQGGHTASSVAEAVHHADVVALMLPDSPDVEHVLLDEGGVFANAEPGSLVVDFSTIRPDVARSTSAAGAELGFRVLDAPVSGGEQGARDAALSIMVGGDDAAVAAVMPVLEAVGRTIVHVGPSGAGQTVKAANQLIVAGTIELVAEAMVFLEAHGLDVAKAVEVLAGGLAGSAVLDRKAAGMVARQYKPGFRVALHHKDLGIALSSARDAGVATPMGALAGQLVGALVAQGRGDLDHSALLAQVEELSGRSAASGETRS
ncbi:MAG TPA: NAD(P)-dependent oxidoreductase [Nocardioides sp.]|jgi:2-hydroxy-3-oxopropionate reductase|uniref:NAD(P)-dependent oxidoreductase n=1 Tax=Nocardioides sp. TaxID=35761 RepID=UPI002E2EEE6F|nr:NAD(P)-dependent oxidoreductase [Nocardioides sp.]HEX3931796.1 NAD(P)-dependent oxidoreductase [Nocardioides sp.]